MLDKQKEAARQFAETWKGRGYEKGESQPFWLQLLREVYGVERPEQFISFEEQVRIDNASFIDGYIERTHVMIEQKSLGKSLSQAIKQADGSLLTPFQQAKRYIVNLPVSKHPRYVVTCNFAEFWIYDMEKPLGEPEKIRLEDLPTEYYRLQFLVESGKEVLQRQLEVSVRAGELVGLLYDAFAKQYADPACPESMHSLNVLCVRLVFCLYAEDAGVFGKRDMFHDYLNNFPLMKMRKALKDLFRVLNQRPEERDPDLKDDDPLLAAFPYVNGGLFAGEDLDVPMFTEEIRDLLLKEASLGFDWSQISPTIFGAVFESTLNPETRRSGGMHYTSVENIQKVINPLFMDDLNAEFARLCAEPVEKTRQRSLREFQTKLASLRFLDPACGSGNFLTESYLLLRRLENQIIVSLTQGQSQLAWEEFNPIKVSLSQFHGIEINEFAVSVAKTALWIAESQMMAETERIVRMQLDFLPLKTSANIVQGNALRLDWETLVPRTQLSYIMGNPPFVGGMMMNRTQKEEITDVVGKDIKGVGEMDYVIGWYYKAAQLMQGTSIRAALVSTNSICQGQQAVTMWKPLFERDVHIDFAHRTFRWDSEASIKAHVHCVIVGFSIAPNNKPKIIYDGDRMQEVSNINSYLIDADSVFVENRGTPLCDVPPMRFGSMPRDGGGFTLTDEEREEILSTTPQADKWIHKYLGAQEFINNKSRWCLWLVGASPHEIRQCPAIMKRVEFVRDFRAKSIAEATRKFADTPTLFCQIAQPDTDYIMVPRVSSERRKYVPMGFLDSNVIASDACQVVPDATLYHFGVLTSNVHMAWMRAVCGRLKSDYRYSKDGVYNNFPWPLPTEEQRERIEETARAILDARALYPDSSLADLYDETTMPPELRTAHQRNDRAVCAAYGWNAHSPEFSSESACVSTLMKMYQRLTSPKSNE